MHEIYRQTRFLTSARFATQFPPDQGFEAAFAGRSNAGKSSALNAICGQKALARVSKTPGRTQMINFFTLAEDRFLVDLPGYGYANAPAAERARWHGLVEDYLLRESLRGLVVIMDIRRPLTEADRQLLEYVPGRLPVHILLAKADKLSRGAALNTAQRVQREFSDTEPPVSVQVFSALKRQGVEEARAVLDEWLEWGSGG